MSCTLQMGSELSPGQSLRPELEAVHHIKHAAGHSHHLDLCDRGVNYTHHVCSHHHCFQNIVITPNRNPVPTRQ